ncbi:MAG: activator of (R)-2-hydroxyglutaryl-CoA dehydratase [Bacteroidia bacterium]|nr:activator of (R)-2-hydroxyglutaryl-CoA dehydratase [Bacteroidia bacterium]
MKAQEMEYRSDTAFPRVDGMNGSHPASARCHREVKSEHYRQPLQTPFTRSERDHVTLLFGGLTFAHERLFKALLESRGFRVCVLPTPVLADYQTGRQYANNGFCNPLYFTGGSLIAYLRNKEREGLSREEICRSFVYVTSRSCGPCRLGLYEQEYRNILRNAGYSGLRVFAFSDTVSLRTGNSDEGLPFDVHFYTNLFSAVMLGDILNDLANRTRPFEREPGATDRAWEESIRFAEERLRNRPRLNVWMERRLPSWLRAPLEIIGRAVSWVMDARFFGVILHARRQFLGVRIDPFRVRPAVKLIGEFWAQTTLGDGNFRAHSFLERHGAEVVVEPVTTWVLYLLFEADQKLRLQKTQLRHNRGEGIRAGLRFVGRMLLLGTKSMLPRIAEMLVRAKYNTIRLLFRGVPDPLPDIYELARLAGEYYNPALLGGESHMEVGKTLYYTQRKRAHMIVSLKPFGCLPSGMSDGVQPLVRAHHPDTLYLSIETSGEGSTNAQSRMLMVLNTARERAERENDAARNSLRESHARASERIDNYSRDAHALLRLRARGVYACRAASELASLRHVTPSGRSTTR